MTWLEAHRESEMLASEAEIAMHEGERPKAFSLYWAAATKEADSLSMIGLDKPKTLGVSAVSAAALFFKAREFDLAEHLAISCLAREGMPQFAKVQLKAIVQTIWNEQVFRTSGVEFVHGELLVGIAGGVVAVGAAPLDLVHRKVEEVKNLFFRAVEMLLDLPLRKHGTPAQEVRDQFRPWIVQAPAGSYQFALRVEKPRQMELFQSAAPDIEEVTSKLFRIVAAASTGSIDALESSIPKMEYRDCFLKQVRNLAPTGKTFKQLTIQSIGHEELKPVVFSADSRKILSETLRARTKESSGEEYIAPDQLTGVLRGVQLDKDWLEILEERTGQTIRILQAGAAIDDIVGPMVNHKVTVEVTVNADGRRIFRDIQSFE
jgi:hypothetical protein